MQFVQASGSDIGSLIALMREFYAIEHLRFDETVATEGLGQLFDGAAPGVVYLIAVDGVAIGYFVLAFSFSLEFHGRYAWLDELYLREPWRGHGIGAAALGFIEQLCRDRGFAALRLEVARENAGAERLYRRSGYEDYSRDLLTKWIR